MCLVSFIHITYFYYIPLAPKKSTFTLIGKKRRQSLRKFIQSSPNQFQYTIAVKVPSLSSSPKLRRGHSSVVENMCGIQQIPASISGIFSSRIFLGSNIRMHLLLIPQLLDLFILNNDLMMGKKQNYQYLQLYCGCIGLNYLSFFVFVVFETIFLFLKNELIFYRKYINPSHFSKI